MALVLVPGNVESLWGENLADAVLNECLIMGELRDIVDTPSRSLWVIWNALILQKRRD